jgi:hypothetical protein
MGHTKATDNDAAYMNAMIPRYSIAILTSDQTHLSTEGEKFPTA